MTRLSRKPGSVRKPIRKPRRKLTMRRRKNTASRANPLNLAEERFQAFHGRPSDEVLEIKTEIHGHSALAGLGKLERLIIVNDRYRVTLKKFGGAVLAMNEQATQLFIDGGDQAVNLADFGITDPIHEKEILGRCERVIYFTTKDHLRPEDGGTANYNHKFGRNKPFIVYDTVNQLLEFAGGGYTLPDEGIDQ